MSANISIICIIIIIAINCGAYIMHQVLLQELHIISRGNNNCARQSITIISFKEETTNIQGGWAPHSRWDSKARLSASLKAIGVPNTGHLKHFPLPAKMYWGVAGKVNIMTWFKEYWETETEKHPLPLSQGPESYHQNHNLESSLLPLGILCLN